MILARVKGNVVATMRDPELAAHKLLLVQPIGLDGEDLDKKELVAVDIVDAGPGDRVLVFKEGGGARILFDNPKIPLQLVVIAVVDDVELAPSAGESRE